MFFSFFYYFLFFFFFFFNDPATTEIYTLSLHDALPISRAFSLAHPAKIFSRPRKSKAHRRAATDRKSTRLNSSHRCISYAVFCLKKKKKKKKNKKKSKKNKNITNTISENKNRSTRSH